MESTPDTSQPTDAQDKDLCIYCNINHFQAGYANKLCAGCREQLINYPIPKWIKAFAVGLLIVMAVSLIRTQMYISAAVHLSRGEKAIEDKHYVKAQKKISKALTKFPDDITVNGNMLIASAYNKIIDKKIEDDQLFSQLTLAMKYLNENSSNDTTLQKKITSAASNKAELNAIYLQIDTSTDLALKTYLANQLYDLRDYPSVEKIMNDVLKQQPKFYSGLMLMAAVKRESGQYDEALKYCDQMLEDNVENVYAIAQKARIELKRKHDKQGYNYALDAMKLDSTNDYALESMAMANHFTGHENRCMADVSIIKAHVALSKDSTVLKRITSIINGSVIYR